jgi:hypothetical protein
MPTPLWVSRQQIPEVFGINSQAVIDAINTDAQIDVRYMGRKPLYNVENINDWINSLPADKPDRTQR